MVEKPKGGGRHEAKVATWHGWVGMVADHRDGHACIWQVHIGIQGAWGGGHMGA